MKANEFKAVIRRLVIEEVEQEVQRQVAKQLPKMLFEMLGQKPQVQSKTLQQTVVREDISSDPDAAPKPRTVTDPTHLQKKVVKRYAKNPMLNAILNETTPGLPQTQYVETGVPLPNFDKIGGVSEEFKAEMREILNEGREPQTVVEEVFEEPTTPLVGPDLSKLFNKNFKAILDKSKKGHGGNFSGAIQSW
jgi:hypothetical protein